MDATTLRFENATFTRVAFADVPVPGELVGLSADQIAAAEGHQQPWTTGDQVNIGAAAWAAEIAGQRVIFDPLQASDEVLRTDPTVEAQMQSAMAQNLADAGFPADAIDAVILTHIDGVGIVGRRTNGQWAPFFPNARVLISEQELLSFDQSLATGGGSDDPGAALVIDAFTALRQSGLLQTFADGEEVLPGLRAEFTGGHGPGHTVFHYTATGAAPLTLIGHLAVSPLHLATGPCPLLHDDPPAAWQALTRLAADGRPLIGPLWPEPGCGRQSPDGFTAIHSLP